MKIQPRSKLLAATTSRTWICDDYSYAISIREAEETQLPRSSHCGKWLNTSFYDLTEGPGIATADDIRAVCRFAEEWVAVGYADELRVGSFYIGEDCKWSNGDPLTAQDFAFTGGY